MCISIEDEIEYKIVFVKYYYFFYNFKCIISRNCKKNWSYRQCEISSETIKSFSSIKINDDIDENTINASLKSLYESNFFKNVNIKFKQNTLIIEVVENPIIQNLNLDGVKSQRIRDNIFNNLNLKPRGSFFEKNLIKDINLIKSLSKDLGYYFAKVDATKEILDDNKVNITFKVDLGEKAKINKISFIGDKIYKDSKLRSVIVSEEYKFWKFISGKKYLNEKLNKLDLRLLKNFYLNKGYYNVDINSSFAKMISENEFELIFNINSNEKIYFDNLELNLPADYDKENFQSLEKLFSKVKGLPYSINIIQEILDEIDLITINEQYESIKASVNENITSNKINIVFTIEDTEKLMVEKINIFGNNVTNENVVRNQLLIDEGDPYNEILSNRSINNIKGLNFFKSVKKDVVEGKNPKQEYKYWGRRETNWRN